MVVFSILFIWMFPLAVWVRDVILLIFCGAFKITFSKRLKKIMKVKHYVLFAFTARKAGWYLLLPPLRAYCWQTDCRHSGGEEPEKDGCWWPIRYVCVKICSKLCRLVKVENQLIFCWRSLGWEGKGSCTLPECCGLCFLESWGMTEYIRTNSRLKKKKSQYISFHSKTRSEVLHNQMTVQALCTFLLSCCLEINTDYSGKRKNLTTIPIVCLISQNVSISLQCCR